MSTSHRAWIDGVALWAPALPGWDGAARAALRGEPVAITHQRRPAPQRLAANERRRAPDTVLLALAVAEQAVADSGHEAAALASVFASAHGDLAITDALCRTLADDPLLLSPLRFHHSVHNAASGYWAIASGSRAASTALAAFSQSFANGLLEALAQCAAESEPVLLCTYDTEACGALASVNRSRGLLALGLVLSPRPGPRSRWALAWSLQPGAAEAPPLHSAAAQALATNASADALPLAEALARGGAAHLRLPLHAKLALDLELRALVAHEGEAPGA
ncbi:Ketoacyl_synth_N domain-containing protein [Rubrivivax sp. A210]|uniref:beta-ketoacyl synthase chain length factor n=1 Tax=Rubrivivax sp. A210 TaxID=2772301 RepID=UPI00191A4C95|nr:beta-ketoacyl synthase chain length factor [Rubrivivax sp. A210]CAD5372057.1 Ketoacyl_synth_N domain-containing protein [Rubrivivax sp. A210]